ncbi:MAG: type II secretion system F family protein [Deltaproteobacteria bacterium]|nr:type II secretion system F family protein [Deltaproteobacteria bacterium]
MSFYSYSAIDGSGTMVKGVLEAESTASAQQSITARGLYLVSINQSANLIGKLRKMFIAKRISRNEIIEFAQNLSVMIAAGIPIMSALEDIVASTTNRAFRDTILDVKRMVERGSSFSEAVESQGAIFPDIFKRLVKVGEQTGRFDTSLKDAADHLLRMQNLSDAIKRALMYPAFAIVTTMGALVFWLTFVLPKIAEALKSMGVKLPPLTRALIAISDFVPKHWTLIVIVILAFPVTFYLMGKMSGTRHLRDRIKLKIPIFSMILYNRIVATFVEQMRILIMAGLSIDRTLNLLIPSLGNVVFQSALERARDSILNGSLISESLKEQDVFPPLVIRMINIGETSGTLDNQLGYLSSHYLKKLDDISATLGKLIEPIVMIVVGALFGVIIAGLLLPVYDLVGKMGKV